MLLMKSNNSLSVLLDSFYFYCIGYINFNPVITKSDLRKIPELNWIWMERALHFTALVL